MYRIIIRKEKLNMHAITGRVHKNTGCSSITADRKIKVNEMERSLLFNVNSIMKIDKEYIVTTMSHWIKEAMCKAIKKRGQKNGWAITMDKFQLCLSFFLSQRIKREQEIEMKWNQSYQECAQPQIMNCVSPHSKNVCLVYNTDTHTHSGVREPTKKQQVPNTARWTEGQT